MENTQKLHEIRRIWTNFGKNHDRNGLKLGGKFPKKMEFTIRQGIVWLYVGLLVCLSTLLYCIDPTQNIITDVYQLLVLITAAESIFNNTME